MVYRHLTKELSRNKTGSHQGLMFANLSHKTPSGQLLSVKYLTQITAHRGPLKPKTHRERRAAERQCHGFTRRVRALAHRSERAARSSWAQCGKNNIKIAGFRASLCFKYSSLEYYSLTSALIPWGRMLHNYKVLFSAGFKAAVSTDHRYASVL